MSAVSESHEEGIKAALPELATQLRMYQLELRNAERRLRERPGSPALRFERAWLLEHTGRVAEAREQYRGLINDDPTHAGALNNLGNMLVATHELAEARCVFAMAVEAHPDHLASRANLGNVLLRLDELELARNHFNEALRLDSNFRPAHAGLSLVLDDLGDAEDALIHRQRAFAGRCIVTGPYRGEKPPFTILELTSTTGGNIRTDHLLKDEVFQRILVTTEFFQQCDVLPPHQIVVNAIGDADAAEAALNAALEVLKHTDAPIINHPAAVLHTGRCATTERLSGLKGVVAAKTRLFPRSALLAPDAEALLADEGFSFPLLLRSPGFHGGDHFLRAEKPAELAEALSQIPGEETLVIEYLDARGHDGRFRKYRMMMVDGALFPLHLAISGQWKIHYYSADMEHSPENRAEEATFLQDPERVLGTPAMSALRAIESVLGLDYGGVDFGLNTRGEIILFEANATMGVFAPKEDEQWDYRRPAVDAIYDAVHRMLADRAASAVDRSGRHRRAQSDRKSAYSSDSADPSRSGATISLLHS